MGNSEKTGRRPSNAGQKEYSGKKQSNKDGKDSEPDVRTREDTHVEHRSEDQSSSEITEKIESGKRTTAGRKDKP